MKKFVHEMMEDLFFPPESDRKAFYAEYDQKFALMFSEILKNGKDQLDPAVVARMSDLVAVEDGWRPFAKLLTGNFMLSYIYMQSTIHRGGDKIYHLTADLTEALYHTDIEISLDTIKTPFNSFVIYLDSDIIKHIGEFNPLDNSSKFVHEYAVRYIMVEFNESRFSSEGKLMRLLFGYCDEGADPDDYRSWNNSSFLEFEITGHNKINIKKTDDIAQDFPEDSLFDANDKTRASELNRNIINFVFSFLLYVTNKSDDVTLQKPAGIISKTQNPKKLKRLNKQLDGETRYNVYHIGLKYSGAYQRSKSETHLNHRVIVRGHWRNQWYGLNTKLPEGQRPTGAYQKLIWIEPFFKGIDLEDGKKTVYEVG